MTEIETAGEVASGVVSGVASEPTGSARTRRLGRPPRLDRAQIARAAGELGLGQVSMRAVAERLGVSVPGLYHYVSGRDELLRLAAEQSAARITVPAYHGQHWSLWLFEWAEHARAAFVAEPRLLEQFMYGQFGLDRMVDHIDRAIDVLVGQGFTPRAALAAYQLVTECALGAAVSQIHERETAAAGRPTDVEYERLLSRRGADELPNLRAVLASGPLPVPDLREQVATLLIGIAVRRNEPWDQIAEILLPGDGSVTDVVEASPRAPERPKTARRRDRRADV